MFFSQKVFSPKCSSHKKCSPLYCYSLKKCSPHSGGGVCWEFWVPNRFFIEIGYSTLPLGKKAKPYRGFLGKPPADAISFWSLSTRLAKVKTQARRAYFSFPNRSRPITDEYWILQNRFFQVGFKANKALEFKTQPLAVFPRNPSTVMG